MVFHKMMACLIGLCLIVFNVVNTKYPPFFLLAVYVLTIIFSWLEMMVKRHYLGAAFAYRKIYSRRGERADFSMMIKNRYFLPVNHLQIKLRAVRDNGERECFREFKALCEERSDTQVALSLPGEHCAIWEIEMKKACFYDMLRIFKLQLPKTEPMELVVMPSTEEFSKQDIDWLEQVFNEEEYAAYKRGKDATSVFDIREYRAGDKLNQIHWKLTGKMEQVMVKEWGEPLEREVTVFLDLAADGSKEEQLEARDKALGKFYALGEWLCQRQIACRTGVYHKEKDKILYYDVADLAQLGRATEAVLRLPPYPSGKKLQEAAGMAKNTRQSEVLYVSGEGIREIKMEQSLRNGRLG